MARARKARWVATLVARLSDAEQSAADRSLGRAVPSRAVIVPGLAGAVAAGVGAPLAARMVLEEHQDAARGTASPEIASSGTGEQVDRVRCQCADDDVGSASAVVVGCRDGVGIGSPGGDRRA